MSKIIATSVAVNDLPPLHDIAGADGMLMGPESSAAGMVAEVLVSVPGQSIAGGTDEIQHNILGERVLGLPREPQ